MKTIELSIVLAILTVIVFLGAILSHNVGKRKRESSNKGDTHFFIPMAVLLLQILVLSYAPVTAYVCIKHGVWSYVLVLAFLFLVNLVFTKLGSKPKHKYYVFNSGIDNQSGVKNKSITN